jgi:hypothetical protein
MKRSVWILLVVCSVLGAYALGQEQGEKKGGEMDMAAWMEIGQTGPEHAALAKIAGDWTSEVKSWMQPGADPMVSKGKSTYKVVMDGRYIRQDYQGDMMGTPFTGVGFLAYNRGTGKYESIWMDSMSTGIMHSIGTETEKGKVWEYKGSFFGPDAHEVKSRIVITEISDDQQVMEMHCDFGSGEFKNMEMRSTRVK